MSVAVDRSEDAVLRDLYDEHASALLTYASRLTNGDRRLAEDIVQETLIRAWRRLDTFDERRGSLRPWLFTVARRIAIDMHRATASRPTEVSDEAFAVIPTADELDSTLDRILLTDALGALSAEHRAVLVETFYRGRSIAEASTVLAIPPGTVKSRSYYALRALKLALTERGIDT